MQVHVTPHYSTLLYDFEKKIKIYKKTISYTITFDEFVNPMSYYT